jgi:hypothetical protein
MNTTTPGIHNLTGMNLAGFSNGSENMYFHPLFRAVKYTDGVQYIGANGADWLLVLILSTFLGTPKLKREEFLCITFTTKDHTGVVIMTDGNSDKPLYKQDIPFTDFPLPEIKFFLTDGVLMLASEY